MTAVRYAADCMMPQNSNESAVGEGSPSEDLQLQGAHFAKPSVQPPGHFNASARKDVSEEWKMWRQQWENYSILTNLSNQPDRYQTALLLHSVGPECLRVYNGMKFDNDAESLKCSVIMKKFDAHFLGESREFFERFKFNQRNQEDGESIEQYVTVLRTMSKSCGFCECMKDKLLIDRMLLGVKDDRMRELLIAKSDLDVKTAVDTCKAVEATSAQMKALKSEDTSVHRVRQSLPKARRQFGKQKPKGKDFQRGKSECKKCKFCLRSHEMKKESCPAWGRWCEDCNQLNHFKGSSVCTAKSVHHVEDEEEYSSTESISFVKINAVDADKEPVLCSMLINGKRVSFQLDSGATVSLLPQKYLTENDEIRSANIRLSMWNRATTQALGKCKLVTRNPATGKKYRVDYVVVKEDLPPLLSKSVAEKMKLITVHYDHLELVRNVVPKDISETVAEEYPDVFASSSSGTLPGTPVRLTVMDDASPSVDRREQSLNH